MRLLFFVFQCSNHISSCTLIRFYWFMVSFSKSKSAASVQEVLLLDTALSEHFKKRKGNWFVHHFKREFLYSSFAQNNISLYIPHFHISLLCRRWLNAAHNVHVRMIIMADMIGCSVLIRSAVDMASSLLDDRRAVHSASVIILFCGNPTCLWNNSTEVGIFGGCCRVPCQPCSSLECFHIPDIQFGKNYQTHIKVVKHSATEHPLLIPVLLASRLHFMLPSTLMISCHIPVPPHF